MLTSGLSVVAQRLPCLLRRVARCWHRYGERFLTLVLLFRYSMVVVGGVGMVFVGAFATRFSHQKLSLHASQRGVCFLSW